MRREKQWAVWFVWQSEGFIPKQQIPCHLSTDLRSRGHDLADATTPSLLLTFRDGALHRVDRHLRLLAGYSVRAGGSGDEGKVARRKETNSWKIDFSGEKPATPLLDTINYPIHMKNLSTRKTHLAALFKCTTQVHGIEDNINSDFHDGASLDMFTSDEDVEIPSHSTYIEARGDRGC
ncbi:hypothetical protein AAC387_Pa11g1155 [Persea americana]